MPSSRRHCWRRQALALVVLSLGAVLPAAAVSISTTTVTINDPAYGDLCIGHPPWRLRSPSATSRPPSWCRPPRLPLPRPLLRPLPAARSTASPSSGR
jgi:hypothetical protein